jgi:predicted nucleic acid-binding protein
MAGEFLDSNVLVYAFTDDARAATAQALLDRGCTISVQGLNEIRQCRASQARQIMAGNPRRPRRHSHRVSDRYPDRRRYP